MRIAPLADVKARLSAYLDECGVEGPVVITRNGKAAAVLLVPYDDDDLERLMLGRSPRFQALLDRSRKSIKEGKGLSEEAFWEAVRKRAQERKAAAAKGRRTAKSPLKSRYGACLSKIFPLRNLNQPSRAGGSSKPRGRERWRTGASRDQRPQRSVACSTLACARPRSASVRPLAPRHGRHGFLRNPAWLVLPGRQPDALGTPAPPATAPHAPAGCTDR
jgi:prevent-host-death family protein